MVSKVKKTKEKTIDKEKVVREFASELLKLMGTTAGINVSTDKENDAVTVEIEGNDEAGLLIGNHGETLMSLQSIMGMAYQQKTGEWQRILVNISDWRERQEERLVNLAHQTAQRARETSESQTLYNLNASQRRIVHLTLAQEKDVQTESQGEGKERYMLVSLKKK